MYLFIGTRTLEDLDNKVSASYRRLLEGTLFCIINYAQEQKSFIYRRFNWFRIKTCVMSRAS